MDNNNNINYDYYIIYIQHVLITPRTGTDPTGHNCPGTLCQALMLKTKSVTEPRVETYGYIA
eukprot:690557-Prorocentrum_lima.AAC.1